MTNNNKDKEEIIKEILNLRDKTLLLQTKNKLLRNARLKKLMRYFVPFYEDAICISLSDFEEIFGKIK